MLPQLNRVRDLKAQEMKQPSQCHGRTSATEQRVWVAAVKILSLQVIQVEHYKEVMHIPVWTKLAVLLIKNMATSWFC